MGTGINAFGRFNNPKQRAWFAANVANNKYGYTLEDYDKYLEEKKEKEILMLMDDNLQTVRKD